jgi:hypothetical protein
VSKSPVQNSAGVNALGQISLNAEFWSSSYKQFPTSQVTAKLGITPGWFQ